MADTNLQICFPGYCSGATPGDFNDVQNRVIRFNGDQLADVRVQPFNAADWTKGFDTARTGHDRLTGQDILSHFGLQEYIPQQVGTN
jgi:hypothetical protein